MARRAATRIRAERLQGREPRGLALMVLRYPAYQGGLDRRSARRRPAPSTGPSQRYPATGNPNLSGRVVGPSSRANRSRTACTTGDEGGGWAMTLQALVRPVLAVGMAFGLITAGAGAALACGGLVAPGHAEALKSATTLAAWHDGYEHYVTGFEFA